MGTTSPDGIYWPSDVNLPANVTQDMQLNAESVQTALHARMPVTPTTGPVALGSGWQGNVGQFGPPTVVKTGQLCVMRGLAERTAVLNVTDNTTYRIGAVPAGFRPTYAIRVSCPWVATVPNAGGNISVTCVNVLVDGTVEFVANFTGTMQVAHWVSLAGVSWIA